MQDISALGVRRVSVGGALARTAWGAFMRAARLMAENGQFEGLANAASSDELDSFFHDDLAKRGPA
jgi:2-methylisocitrate lyase-like PEP mutase family enzyme